MRQMLYPGTSLSARGKLITSDVAEWVHQVQKLLGNIFQVKRLHLPLKYSDLHAADKDYPSPNPVLPQAMAIATYLRIN